VSEFCECVLVVLCEECSAVCEECSAVCEFFAAVLCCAVLCCAVLCSGSVRGEISLVSSVDATRQDNKDSGTEVNSEQ
jgi:hypothetical protein